jgi:hypothetical protein
MHPFVILLPLLLWLPFAAFSYNRWWEAYTAVYLMHSKWLDLATELAAFHYQSHRYDEHKPPSFGANPGIQSLANYAPDMLAGNENADLNVTSADSGEKLNLLSNVGDRGNVVGSSALPGTGEWTPPPTPKRAKILSPNNTRTRHAKTTTMTDLMEQMDACEAEEEIMQRQSLLPDRSSDEEDEGESDDIFAGSESSFDQIDSEKGEGGTQTSARRKQSWFQKMKKKHSEAKSLRKSKKQERLRRREEALSVDVGADVTISKDSVDVNSKQKQHIRFMEDKERPHQRNQKQRNQKIERRRTRHDFANSQPATTRLVKERKIIGRGNRSHIPQERLLDFCDRFDVKTGQPYSLFTANSRRHLREGHLDPDKVPPMLFLEECAHLLSLMSAVAFSTLRNDLPEAESPLTVFEPGLPWPLVDPDAYKGRVRKGWTKSKYRFYSVLQFGLGRSRTDRARTLYNAARPFRVIGNVSDAEIEKLQEARGPLAKVSLISMWLLELISREIQAGSTGDVAAPILSRLYQFISEGLAGYNQARKIAYIPFPFPHAQITTLYLLIVDFFVTPLLMTTFVTNPAVGCFLNLFSVLCFTGLHEVAREIESPFTNIPNDVPLNNYQAQFNEGLMVMFYGYHPDAYWNNKQKKGEDGTAKNDSDGRKANLERKKGSVAEVSAVSNECSVNSTSSDGGSRTTPTKSLRIRHDGKLTTNHPPARSESTVSVGESHPEEGPKPSKMINIGGGMNSSFSLPTSDTQMDDFLRAFVGNRIDPPSEEGSFQKVPMENDSIRSTSDKPAPSPVMFRIPQRTSIDSFGVQTTPDEFDSSFIMASESLEEKDVANGTKNSD